MVEARREAQEEKVRKKTLCDQRLEELNLANHIEQLLSGERDLCILPIYGVWSVVGAWREMSGGGGTKKGEGDYLLVTQ